MVSSSRPGLPSSFNWRKSLAALLVLAGVGVIALSFFSPGKTSQRHAWTDTQAQLYQASSAKLHALSHQLAQASPDQRQAVENELSKAQADYDALRHDLESAIERPNQVAWFLRIAGLLCIAVGGGLLYFLPDATDSQNDGKPSKALHIRRNT